jgi:hypothetical protein
MTNDDAATRFKAGFEAGATASIDAAARLVERMTGCDEDQIAAAIRNMPLPEAPRDGE